MCGSRGAVVALVVAAWCTRAAAPPGADSAQASAPPTSTELAALDPADLEVPAWRDLWYGSLEALHREPTINNTQEEVLAQLGSLAFLHCPVRNLGERGVCMHAHMLNPGRPNTRFTLKLCRVVGRCHGCGVVTGTSSARGCSCTPTTNASRCVCVAPTDRLERALRGSWSGAVALTRSLLLAGPAQRRLRRLDSADQICTEER